VGYDIVTGHGCRDGISNGEIADDRLTLVVVDLVEPCDLPTLIVEMPGDMTT
jgi:hypothetical protein